MKASVLNQRPVVSLSDGARVGSVADLTLDATHQKVTSIVLAGHDGPAVVPFPAVKHFGADAVTIDDSTSVRAAAEAPEGGERRMSTLTGLTVLTQDGTIVGKVDDLEFDAATGQITGLQVSHGGMLGFGGSHQSIAPSAIKGFGANLITVELPTPPAAAQKR